MGEALNRTISNKRQRLAPGFALVAMLVASAMAATHGQAASPLLPPSQCQGFLKIREAVRQEADQFKKIMNKHRYRKEVCAASVRFSEAEDRMVKFLEHNKDSCGIADELVHHAKLLHSETLKFRDRVCAEGPMPTNPPPWLDPTLRNPTPLNDVIAATPLGAEKYPPF